MMRDELRWVLNLEFNTRKQDRKKQITECIVKLHKAFGKGSLVACV